MSEPRPASRLLLVVAAVLVALTVWALLAGTSVVDVPRASEDDSDLALYEQIADRVRAGEGYYAAAVAEQASNDYPTSPPPTIRLPTVTFLAVVLGDGTVWVLRALLALFALGVMLRLERIAPTRLEWILATLLGAVGLGMFAATDATYFSEAWALALMGLSLVVHRRGRWLPAVALGVAAVLFRELAAPYLVVMGLVAWRRHRREALTWWAGAVAFLPVYAVHWAAASRAAEANRVVGSDGWLAFGGWPYVVDTFRACSILTVAPYAVAALALAGALAGWWAVRGDYRTHVLATSIGFAALFLVAGRPDTVYWGCLYAPLLVPGLVFLPRFVAQTFGVIVRERRGGAAAHRPTLG